MKNLTTLTFLLFISNVVSTQIDVGGMVKNKVNQRIEQKTNEAIDKILQMQELFGLTRFSAHMDVGGPSHQSLMKSIEIYGTKIAPKIRESLKK